MSEGKAKCGIITAVVVLCLAVVIIVPMSFSYVEYYEFAFYRKKSTGFVDITEVIDPGRHFYGPDADVKTFKADAHYLTLDKVDIFTLDKLEVELTAHMQYFLRKEDLSLLHEEFDVEYEEVLKASATDALKGATTTFSVRDVILDRKRLEETLHKAVSQRLGGTCCAKDCNAFETACLEDCLTGNKCTNDKKGLFADVKYFQLGEISLPSKVSEPFMKVILLKEEDDTEHLKQDAALVRKNTTAQVQQIVNEASEITQRAHAEAGLITSISEANYTKTLEEARTKGLKEAFLTLGVTQQDYRNSINYLKSLKGLNHAHFTVDFEQRIAGTLK